ncbi:MAG: hypothetical protein NTV08_11555 [Verrucomicrobia bacterium]|nr:hypothetical protein [Verrucomicrobiota bacterium]
MSDCEFYRALTFDHLSLPLGIHPGLICRDTPLFNLALADALPRAKD